jgi:hypothetical protein
MQTGVTLPKSSSDGNQALLIAPDGREFQLAIVDGKLSFDLPRDVVASAMDSKPVQMRFLGRRFSYRIGKPLNRRGKPSKKRAKGGRRRGASFLLRSAIEHTIGRVLADLGREAPARLN